MNKIKLTAAACIIAASSAFTSSALATENSWFVKVIGDGRDYTHIDTQAKKDFSFGSGVGFGYQFEYVRLGFDVVNNKVTTKSDSEAKEIYGSLRFDGIMKVHNNIRIFGGLGFGASGTKKGKEVLRHATISPSVGAQYSFSEHSQVEVKLGIDFLYEIDEDKHQVKKDVVANSKFGQIGIIYSF